MGFAEPGQEQPDTTYVTVSNRPADGRLEVRSGPLVWTRPGGDSRLFVHTAGGTLEQVSGAVTLVRAG